MNEVKGTSDGFLQILKKLQIDTVESNLHEEKCTCETHGEYTSYVDDEGNGTGCPVCAEKYKAEKRKKELEQEQKEEQERIEEQKKVLHIQKCKRLNISPEFYFVTLDDYIPETKAQEEAKKAVAELIEKKSGKIILLGNNGCGKTMLGSIACMAMDGCIYTMYEISTMIRQSYTSKAVKSELEILEDLIEPQLLVIDEVGRISNSEAVQNWFSFLLDKRHSRKKATILNGNLHFKKDCESGGCPKCFENYFDKDVLSRFHEDTTVIVIKSSDERKKKQTMKYFSD